MRGPSGGEIETAMPVHSLGVQLPHHASNETLKRERTMWKSVEELSPTVDATFDIWVSKGPMKGLQRECDWYAGDWYNNEDLVAPEAWVSHVRSVPSSVGPHDKIAGRTLAEWQELARRDDCFEQMVPSDLRTLLKFIT